MWSLSDKRNKIGVSSRDEKFDAVVEKPSMNAAPAAVGHQPHRRVPRFQRNPLGEVPMAGGSRGSGNRPSVASAVARKKPRLLAGFFRLERLFVQRLSVSERFEFVLDIREPTVEARFHRIYALLQALEAASDGNGDVVAVLVNDALDLFEVVVV